MFSAAKSSAPAGGAITLTKSLRFRSSASAYLNRTPSSITNRQTWTWSCWVKRGTLGATSTIFGYCSNDAVQQQNAWFKSDDTLQFYIYSSGYSLNLITTQVFRDVSAWYHIVIAQDTTQATDTNRVKIYVNGVQITSFSTAGYPSQNLNGYINSTVAHGIGSFPPALGGYFDGYQTDVYLIDGQQLTPSSFGITDATTGQWVPAKYSGGYGTNGFHLPFTNTTSTTTLGYDTSGNSNNWTTNNISLTAGSTYDSMNDVPTLTSATAANYAVMNPNATGPGVVSDGNLNVSRTSNGSPSSGSNMATMGVSSGKWYWEVYVSATGGNSGSIGIGIVPSDYAYKTGWVGDSSASTGYWGNGAVYGNSTGAGTATAYGAGDTIGVALDMDARTIKFYRNNVSGAGTITGVTGNIIIPAVCIYDAVTASLVSNFGQQPFTYTPPSGFKALNTYNLATPTIVRGNKYMDATIYNGTAGSNAITNSGSFQPDLVWTKSRVNAYQGFMYDSVRGVNKYIISSSTDAEATVANSLTSFNNNGFTLSSSDNSNYASGSAAVAWQWKAGGSTAVTNTAGTITSQVSVNLSSGFSIVTYTGNSTAGATRGHGLNALPKMILIKGRAGLYGVDNWHVYHASLPITQGLQLNGSAAAVTSSYFWNDTNPTTSVFSTNSGSSNNYSGQTYVAYCWSEIPGFSAFGSYTGNGSADGPFVYTGFRPTFVMIKATSATSDWWITDTTRNPSNIINYGLRANTGQAEVTDVGQNILSNGFKYKNDTGAPNQSGVTYIYAAFASVPFKYSNAF